jgi:predicted MPP superfamily phosphohydrolase
MMTSIEPSPGQRISRRNFIKACWGNLLGAAALCTLGLAYATQVEPRWAEVKRLDIPLLGLPPEVEGFTIAQLSDIHVGPHVTAEHVRHGVALTNTLDADLVVLTGDFVYRSAEYSATCARELASLRARYGVYAVLGNHDIWTDADEVAEWLSRAGLVVLRNQRQALTVAGVRLWLLGIEDAGYTGGLFSDFRVMWQEAQGRLAVLLQGIPPAEPRLLLVHNPDFTEMLPGGRIDLALCGHTHGGQVRLPFIGAPVVPSCFGHKYAGGRVRGPGAWVYVNRGLGLISPPVRFLCRPEITLHRLRAVSPASSAQSPGHLASAQAITESTQGLARREVTE